MSLEDRMTFREAKMKELQSFFDNSVWQFDNGKNVPADRVLKGCWSKWLGLEKESRWLSESKGPAGGPRVQGP